MSASARRRLQVLLSTLLVLGSVGTARATDRFVSKAGDDASNDCSSSGAPCATLAHAVTQAASGDAIDVAGGLGVMTEDVVFDSSTALTVSGGWTPDFTSRDPLVHRTILGRGSVDVTAGAGQTIDLDFDGLFFAREVISVAGSADATIHVTATDCTFSGREANIGVSHSGSGTAELDVTRGTFHGSHSYFIGAGAGDDATVDVSVEQSTFQHGGDFAQIGVFTGGTFTLSIDRTSIVNNKTDGRGAIHVQSDVGQATMVSVTNSVIANTGERGGAGIDIIGGTGSTQVTLVNDTIVRNRLSGVAIGGNVTADLTNVIAIDNGRGRNAALFGADLGVSGGAVVNADHDDLGTVRVSPDSILNDLGGNVSVDPRLVKVFELSGTSPLIDAGTCTGAPATDIEGDPRPSGPGCDIGADEFVP